MRDGSLQRYHADACDAIARSPRGLWRQVNQAIAQSCRAALNGHRSRQWLSQRLRRLVGPARQDEPVCLSSLRSAAQQVDDHAASLILI